MTHLAIDIGASSGRHIIGYLENGKMITKEIFRFPNGPKEKGNNLIWDVDSLWKNILNGLKEAKNLGFTPDTIGIDTWGVDYALLDENNKLLGDVYCYRDPKNDIAADKLHKIMPFEEIYKISGLMYNSFNTIYQLYHDKLTGKLDKAYSMLNLPDYFNFLLTGNKRQEYTMSVTTAMVNTKTHEWDETIINKLGYPKRLFGKLSQGGEVVGILSKEIQEYVGYSSKVVLPLTHDTASAVLAAPVDYNMPYISSGTWSILGIERKNALVNDETFKLNYSNEAGRDLSFRFQKNIMGLWITQQIRHELDDKYSFKELESMAKQSPIPDIYDVDDQSLAMPKSMIKAVETLVGRKLTIGELIYTTLHSLAVCYNKCLTNLEELTGDKYTTINIIGGGSNNGLLNELTIKETGRTIVTGPTEGTAIGNLLVQMISSGEIKDIPEGRKIISNSFDIKKIN